MDFTLTDEQTTLREQIISFAQRELNENVIERDQRHEFPHDLWLKCGEMGLQGLPVPGKYGGTGLDPLTTAILLEALGYGCRDGGLVFSLCAHLLSCVIPIWKYGTENQRMRYLPGLCDGRLIAVNAMTEPGSGSDAFAMSTTAVSDGDGFRISGTKTFSSNGPVADLALVFAMTDKAKGYHGGVTAFLVPSETDGFDKGQRFQKMGLRTSPIGELVFKDAYVPRAAILGKVGGGANMFTESMSWERICLFASHLGTMERLLETAIDYARTRRQYGQAIGKFQAVSHRIADMKIQLEAARLLTYKAASGLDKSKRVAMDASMAKVFVSDSLVKAAMDTVQILGGYGYMAEYEVERAFRDAVSSTIYSGTNEMQRNIVARWLGL